MEATTQQQPSVSTTSPATELIQDVCGFCGKKVKVDEEHKFITSCDVCHRKCIIHPNKQCANALWKKTEFYKSLSNNQSEMVDMEQFNEQKYVGLYCIHCRDSCFYCPGETTFHAAGKYFIYVCYMTQQHKTHANQSNIFLLYRCYYNT